jgi:uncharacterized protein YcbK (DUF882 family)
VTVTQLLVVLGLHLHAPAAGQTDAGWNPLASLKASIGIRALSSAPIRVDLAEVKGAEVTFYNVNSREIERFFLPFDGAPSAEDAARLTRLFRCKRSGRQRKPDRGLVQILARLGERYPGRVFELVSAHRATGDRGSKHYSGHAIDFRVRGVSVVELRDYVWGTFSNTGHIGLGQYLGEGFLHIDHRPGEPSIGWVQTRRGLPYRYHPRWSRSAHRQPGLVIARGGGRKQNARR